MGRRILWIALPVLLLLALVAGVAASLRVTEVVCQPADALVKLEGHVCFPLGQGRFLVWRGLYTVVATREGYEPYAAEHRTAGPEGARIEIALAERPGLVHVVAVGRDGKPLTTEVEVLVAGQPASGPALRLAAGTYELTVTHPRYQPARRSLIVEGKGKEQECTVELLPNWGTLSLESTPSGAEIFIDGRRQAESLTPASIELLARDKPYSISVHKKEFKVWRKNVSPLPGVTTKETFALSPSDGVLVVTSTPDRAFVYVDRALLERTPAKLFLTSGQPHLVVLRKEGFEDTSQIIELKPTETKTTTIQLRPKP